MVCCSGSFKLTSLIKEADALRLSAIINPAPVGTVLIVALFVRTMDSKVPFGTIG